MKKIITLCFFLIGIVTASFGQSEKLEDRAQEKVDTFNEPLLEAKVGLTDRQKQDLKVIYIAQLKEIKQVRKEYKDSENKKVKLKEVYQKYSKQIHQEILTKEQKQARKKARESKK